jgi:hypothetical protein
LREDVVRLAFVVVIAEVAGGVIAIKRQDLTAGAEAQYLVFVISIGLIRREYVLY